MAAAPGGGGGAGGAPAPSASAAGSEGEAALAGSAGAGRRGAGAPPGEPSARAATVPGRAARGVGCVVCVSSSSAMLKSGSDRAYSRNEVGESCGTSQRATEGPAHASNRHRTGVLENSPSTTNPPRPTRVGQRTTLSVDGGFPTFNHRRSVECGGLEAEINQQLQSFDPAETLPLLIQIF
jgi:hypothetical protein